MCVWVRMSCFLWEVCWKTLVIWRILFIFDTWEISFAIVIYCVTYSLLHFYLDHLYSNSWNFVGSPVCLQVRVTKHYSNDDFFFFKSYENRKSKLIHIIRRYEFVKKLCINKYHKCLKLLCPLFTDLPVFSGNFWKPNIIGTFGISSLISSLPGVS